MRLNEQHRAVLRAGLHQWGGPARCTDDIASVIGYPHMQAFDADRDRLASFLAEDSPHMLGKSDLRRIIVATEIVFASDLVGAGVDWESVTGFTDVDTLRLLREVQRAYYQF